MNERSAWLVATALLGSVLFLAYGNSFGNGFHYDDFHSLVDNPHVRSLDHWRAFLSDPTAFSSTPDRAMYRPLVLVSYAFNYRLGGYAVGGYHLVNWLVHLGSALAVFALARALTAGAWAALAGALVFALHPLCSEPVNYISSRSESLCALFFLLGLVGYVRGRAGDSRWLLSGLLCFALALLAKSVALVLPVALLWYELVNGPRERGLRPRRLVGIHLAHWLVAVLYLWMARTWLGDSLGEPVRSFSVQWITQVKAMAYYAYLAFFPVRLSVEQPFSVSESLMAATVLSALAALCSLAYFALRGRGAALHILGWALLPLLPSSLMPLNVLVNDHRMYLPLALLCVGLACAVEWPRGKRAVLVAACVGLVAFVGINRSRNAVWLDERSLWQDAVDKAPFAYRAHMHLGEALEQQGARALALAHFERAVQYGPEAAEPHYNLGNALRVRGRFEEALAVYGASLQARAHFAPALLNRAALLQDLDRYEEAEALLQRGLAEGIGARAELWRRLGVLFAKGGRYQQAEATLRQALQDDPALVEAQYNLGNVYFEMGQVETAMRAYESVLRAQPAHAGARRNWGEHLLKTGEYGRAEALFSEGLRLRPDEVIFHYGAARAYEALGQRRAAITSYRRFVQGAALDAAGRAAVVAHIDRLERQLRGEQ